MSPCPFPTTITITPKNICLSIDLSMWVCVGMNTFLSFTYFCLTLHWYPCFWFFLAIIRLSTFKNLFFVFHFFFSVSIGSGYLPLSSKEFSFSLTLHRSTHPFFKICLSLSRRCQILNVPSCPFALYNEVSVEAGSISGLKNGIIRNLRR